METKEEIEALKAQVVALAGAVANLAGWILQERGITASDLDRREAIASAERARDVAKGIAEGTAKS